MQSEVLWPPAGWTRNPRLLIIRVARKKTFRLEGKNSSYLSSNTWKPNTSAVVMQIWKNFVASTSTWVVPQMRSLEVMQSWTNSSEVTRTESAYSSTGCICLSKISGGLRGMVRDEHQHGILYVVRLKELNFQFWVRSCLPALHVWQLQ